MTFIAIKIPVVESEAGWGRKIDDYMVSLNHEDAEAYRLEFNAKNTETSTPSWYMQVEGKATPIDLTEKQYNHLVTEKRVWLSTLNKIV